MNDAILRYRVKDYPDWIYIWTENHLNFKREEITHFELFKPVSTYILNLSFNDIKEITIPSDSNINALNIFSNPNLKIVKIHNPDFKSLVLTNTQIDFEKSIIPVGIYINIHKNCKGLDKYFDKYKFLLF